MKLKGFTLAEVLVTIGIVGVVATMTMPALVSKYKTVEYTSRAKKAYNTLAVAVNEYLRVQGADLLVNTKFFNDPTNELRTVLRVIDNSTNYNTLTKKNREVFTLADAPYDFGGDSAFLAQNFLLPDGIIISMSARQVASPQGVGPAAIVHRIAIDTNGPKGPNQLGRDVFIYNIQNDGFVAPIVENDCFNGGTGLGCSAKLMDDGWEMNY